MKSALQAAARAWSARDPDWVTRESTLAMLDEEAELRRFFGAPLEFGTAGMRGPLGPGPGGMNRANVRRVTAGFADYLVAQGPDIAGLGVVIGFDGRHGSREFAAEAARVLGGAGVPTWLYADVVPTPQLAHAVLHLGAAGGIMVTASHNPPQDNGYKVYWRNGAQIVPPHDAGISALIPALPPADPPPLAARPVPESALAAYLAAVDKLRVWNGVTDVSLVYTAMHGVGRRLVEQVLSRHGYARVHLVTEQVDPDPDFPTVAFPNPEEPGALDLALALARSVQADVVLANDPDADRLAVAVPDGAGGYRALTGNQIGVLLADELLTHGPKGERMVANTIVSTAQLGKIAAHHGAALRRTLTGFKWIANAAIDYEAGGGRFVMGFEEALGYSAGDVVRDKDGVSALLLFCDLVARCRVEGITVLDRLAALYRRDGLHASAQRSVTRPGPDGAAWIQGVMDRLRADPPKQVGGVTVARVIDYESPNSGLPPSNVLAFELADGGEILARPSGTEPKIKFYFEVCVPLAADTPLAQGEAEARARTDELAAAFLALATPKGG